MGGAEMTLDQMRCFVAVADTLSFTEAAKRKFSSQQTISRQIANLEKELGCRLFTRTTKSVALTPQGDALFAVWKTAVADIDRSIGKTAEITEQMRNVLRVGIANIGRILSYTKHGHSVFLKEHPDITLSYKIFPVGRLRDMLISDEVDVILSLASEFSDTGIAVIHSECIAPLDEYIIHARKHPLACKKKVTLKDIDGETVFLLSTTFSPVAENLVLGMMKKEGAAPKELRYCDTLDSLELALYSGEGVAITPNIFFDNPDKALLYRRLAPRESAVEAVVVAWRNDRNKKIKRYVKFLKDRPIGTKSFMGSGRSAP
jgi:DNA-binding transcriptional LysR family regulator